MRSMKEYSFDPRLASMPTTLLVGFDYAISAAHAEISDFVSNDKF